MCTDSRVSMGEHSMGRAKSFLEAKFVSAETREGVGGDEISDSSDSIR